MRKNIKITGIIEDGFSIEVIKILLEMRIRIIAAH